MLVATSVAMGVPPTAPALAAPQTLSTPALPEGNARFVDAAVRDLLGRASTSSDHQRWTARLDRGTLGRGSFSRDVARTPEWARVVVIDLYARILGRATDPSGLAYWSQRLVQGDRTADLAALLYASSEFFDRAGGGTIPGYVDAVYLNALERPADASGRAYWIGRLQAGGPRTRIARQFFLTVESNARRVDALYLKLLNRASDAAGRAYWAQRLVREDDLVLAGLLTSSGEYFDAAQDRVTSATLTTVAGTVVVTPAMVASSSFSDDGSGQVVLRTGVAPPTVGGHLVVSDPADPTGGGVGRATAVASGGGGTTLVTVVGAGLADAFATGEVRSTVETPDATAVPRGHAAGSGPRAGGDASCLTQIGTKVKPSIGIDVRNDSHMEWNVLRGTYDVQALLHLTPRFTATITELSLQNSCSKELWSKGWPVNIPAGPIVIPGQIELSVDADLTAEWEGVNLSSTFAVPCRIGFRATQSGFTNRTGCDGVQRTLSFKPTTEGSLELAGGIRLSYELGVDRGGWARANVGLSAGPKIGIRAEADGTKSPWWKIGAFFEATLEADVELGPWNPSWTIATCCEKEWPWAHAGPGDNPPPPPPLAISTMALPDGVVDEPYAAVLASTGGRGAMTWSATGLPAGLRIVGSRLTGTPTTAGTGPVTLTVRDGTGASRSAVLDLRVLSEPPPPLGTLAKVTEADGSRRPALSDDGVTIVFSRGATGLARWSEGGGAPQPLVSGWSYGYSPSATGRYTAFASGEPGLVPGDADSFSDVFLQDHIAGSLTRIVAMGASLELPVVSSDGATVAFSTLYTDVLPNDTDGDIYVWRRGAGVTRVTRGNSESGRPSISADGRYVAFESRASNLVSGDSNGTTTDIFLYDTNTGAVERVSRSPHPSQTPSISADGSHVVFISDTDGHGRGVMVWNRVTKQTTEVSVDVIDPSGPDISDNGRYVSFSAYDDGLTALPRYAILVDRVTGHVERISPGWAMPIDETSLSRDGRRLAFSAGHLGTIPPDYHDWQPAAVFLWTRTGSAG